MSNLKNKGDQSVSRRGFVKASSLAIGWRNHSTPARVWAEKGLLPRLIN
jgi:hypothetical protein